MNAWNCAGLEPLEARSLLAHIGVDPTFGNAGVAPVDASVSVIGLPDGRIFAVGGGMVTRLNANGSVDASFVDQGGAQAALGKMHWVISDAVISGNRMYVVGELAIRGAVTGGVVSNTVYVRALNLADGSIDTSFGYRGFSSVLLTPVVRGNTIGWVRPEVARMPDGSLALAVQQNPLDHRNSSAGTMYRYDTRGRLDHAFGGGDGEVVLGNEADFRIAGIAADTSGRVFVTTGGTGWGGSIFRYLASGEPDLAFGSDGQTVIPSIGQFSDYGPIVTDAAGKVIFGVDESTDGGSYAHLGRLNADGTRDAQAFLYERRGQTSKPAIDANGRVLMAFGPSIARLLPDFTPDPAFAGDGVADLPTGFSGGPVGADAAGRALVGDIDGITRLIESPSVTLNAKGVLWVEGSNGDDEVTIAPDGRFLNVTHNGETFTFRTANVKSVEIDLVAGNNTVNATINVPANVRANDPFPFGNDFIQITGTAPATIHSGRGDDTIISGDGHDHITATTKAVILAGGGDDEIHVGGDVTEVDAGAGDDLIVVGYESLVWGGDGDDRMESEDPTRTFYRSRFHGENGDDVMMGTDGIDLFSGGPGNDTAVGRAGDDALYGADGDDRLDGGNGDDYLEGGAGHDVLAGGPGADQLFGLAGNDVLLSNDGVKDTVRGGPGTDTGDADVLDDVLGVEVAA